MGAQILPLFCSPVQLGDKDESEGWRVVSAVRAKTVCVCVCVYVHANVHARKSILCVSDRMIHV